MFERFLVLCFIVSAKSTPSVRSGPSDYSVTRKGSNVGGRFNSDRISLAALHYDPVTRRFRFLNSEYHEGRSVKKKRKAGFFGGIYSFFRDAIFGSFWSAKPKKIVAKNKPLKIRDADPISNFLDDLDDLFRAPFKDSPDSLESEEDSETWFGWFDEPTSTKTSVSYGKDDYIITEDDIFTSSTAEDSTLPNKITVIPETTKIPTTTLPTVRTKKPTTVSTSRPTTIKAAKTTTTSKKPTTTPRPTSQYISRPKPTKRITTTKPTTSRPISSRRPNTLNRYPTVVVKKDCANKSPGILASMSQKPIETIVHTTASTGWFNFLSGSDDNDDDDNENQISGPSSGWFGGLFDEESSTKAPDPPAVTSIANLILPITTAPEPTPPPDTGWFNTFLNLEEDDQAYSANNSVKTKKSAKKIYKGFQLLRIYPNSPWKVSSLQDLQEDTQGSGLMWWSSPALNRSADLLVPPDLLPDIKDHLNDENMSYDVVIWDLQKAITFENPKLSKTQRLELEGARGHPLTWRRYHRYADILRYMEYISLKYPDLVELVPLGRSYEGLPIIAAKVSLPENETVTDRNKKKWKLKSKMKPAVWIDGGSHAREWISPAVATWILHTLVEGEHGNGAEMDMLKHADWYILPVMNPDGYEYTHTHDRLWRKSRSMHADDIYFNSWFPWSWGKTECYGVDLNRNWDYHWGEKGSSNDPCSDYYAGPVPFSEPESKSISNFIMSIRDQLKVFLTLHAYSQMWVLPSTHSREPFADKNELMEMGKLALNALKEVSGTKYEIGTLSDLLLPITGTSYDWAKGRAGIKYTYAVKLRDSLGPYGYLLPGSQITHTAKETWEGIKTVVDNL